MAKLKKIVESIFEDKPEINKHQVIESVRNYSIIGKQLYDGHNILQMAEQIAEISQAAQGHILSETDEWFDKVSVNRNMKNMKGMVKEFAKTAKESHILNQRMTALYEDMGTILGRYYEIDEADKGDMDNDGVQEPDDEEYKDNKDKAIKKAMKKENKSLKDVGTVGTPSLGQIVRKFTGK